MSRNDAYETDPIQLIRLKLRRTHWSKAKARSGGLLYERL